MNAPVITLTDTTPMPKDVRCPKCRAVDARMEAGAFGATQHICGRCGFQYPEDGRG